MSLCAMLASGYSNSALAALFWGPEPGGLSSRGGFPRLGLWSVRFLILILRRSLVDQFFFILCPEKAWYSNSYSFYLENELGRTVLLRFASRGSLVEQFFFIFLSEEAW